MLRLLAGGAAVLLLATLVVVLVHGGNVRAQSPEPPRVFQTEVRSWLVDTTTDTTDWTFQYMNDGSLHAVLSTDLTACPTLTVPAGVFVQWIDSSLATAIQPGSVEAIEICEAFFTRANG